MSATANSWILWFLDWRFGDIARCAVLCERTMRVGQRQLYVHRDSQMPMAQSWKFFFKESGSWTCLWYTSTYIWSAVNAEMRIWNIILHDNEEMNVLFCMWRLQTPVLYQWLLCLFGICGCIFNIVCKFGNYYMIHNHVMRTIMLSGNVVGM